MDVDLIIANPANANKHPDKQVELLAKILKYQGWRQPLIISKRSGFLVSGHGRLMAAKKIGLKDVPVSIQNFENEAQEFAHLIADNKIAELAQHDDAKMTDSLLKMDFDLDFDLLGIPDFQLKAPEEAAMPDLKNEPKKELEQITFTLSKDQADTVREAMDIASKMGPYVETQNENKNGNAIARVAEFFIGSQTADS